MAGPAVPYVLSFGFLNVLDGISGRTATCKECGKTIKDTGTTTSNFIRHLRTHPQRLVTLTLLAPFGFHHHNFMLILKYCIKNEPCFVYCWLLGYQYHHHSLARSLERERERLQPARGCRRPKAFFIYINSVTVSLKCIYLKQLFIIKWGQEI